MAGTGGRRGASAGIRAAAAMMRGRSRRASLIAAAVVVTAGVALTAASRSQSLVLAMPAETVVDAGPFDLVASSSAGLPVEVSLEGGPCALDGTRVRLTGVGECTFRARQSGDGWHVAAQDVLRTLRIAKAEDALDIEAPSRRVYGDAPFAVRGSSARGLPVSVGASGPCTVSGTLVTITGAGECRLHVASAGDERTRAASRTSVVTIAQAPQTISFPELAARTYGEAPFPIAATATSGLPVAFSAAGSCSVERALVSIRGAGSCTLTATQGGDANWSAATSASRSLAIAKADQQISLVFPPVLRYGEAAVTPRATASSSLPVTLTAVGACTLVRGAISPKGLIGSDICTITAAQAGDANVNAAEPAVQRVTVIGFSWSCCRVIVAPPRDFCSYFACIANFGNSPGYVMQCRDGLFSTAGGRSGSCSGHGGNARALYSP